MGGLHTAIPWGWLLRGLGLGWPCITAVLAGNPIGVQSFDDLSGYFPT